MVKQMSFVRRAAGVSPGAFAEGWRAVSMQYLDRAPAGARPHRLEHCIVREGRRPAPWHGVAIAWFDDEQAMAEHRRYASRVAIDGSAEDVLERAATETVLVEERCVLGQDWLAARRTPQAGAGVLLIGFIQRAPHLTRTEFRDYWWEQHRPLANALIPPGLQPVAYIHDYVLPAEACPWDGLGEMYETSIDNARERAAWFDSPAAAPLLADEERFLLRGTRQVLMTDHQVIV